MTFDLEKARASDEALPYPLDAKEIWISGKGQMHINPPNEPSIFFTLSDLCEFRNLFHGQAAEIERLRAKVEKMEFLMRSTDDTCLACAIKLEVIDQQAARIQELGAQLALITSALENATGKPDVIDATGTGNLDFSDTNVVDDLIKNGNHLRARAQKAETRIKELEDAHKRSGAKYAKIINELRSSVYANIPGLKKQWDEILNTPANGKIGPEDAKPRSWKITDERKAAILHCKRMLTFLKEDDAPCYDVEKITKDESVLVAMLKEAGQ